MKKTGKKMNITNKSGEELVGISLIESNKDLKNKIVNSINAINAVSNNNESLMKLPIPETNLPNFPFNGDMKKWKKTGYLTCKEEKYLKDRINEGYVVSHASSIGSFSTSSDYSPVPPKIIGRPNNKYEYKNMLFRKFLYENELDSSYLYGKQKCSSIDSNFIRKPANNVDKMTLTELVKFRDNFGQNVSFNSYFDNNELSFCLNLNTKLLEFKQERFLFKNKVAYISFPDILANKKLLSALLYSDCDKNVGNAYGIFIGTLNTNLNFKEFISYIKDSMTLFDVNWRYYHFNYEELKQSENKFKKVYDIIGGNR